MLLHWHTSDRAGENAVHARSGELILDQSSWTRLRSLIPDSSIITLVEPRATPTRRSRTAMDSDTKAGIVANPSCCCVLF